jgi:ATP-dependent Lhr-like helicase
VFRDLLDREAGTPRWWELLQVYRRLEARGEIRGGRFITGVAGEQFALGDTVKKLRQLRDDTPDSANRNISNTAAVRAGFLSSGDADASATQALNQPRRTANTTSAIGNAPSDELVMISAADPLNLVGIITQHARVPATAHNRIALLNGKPIAAMINGEVSFLDAVRATQRDGLARALHGQNADVESAGNQESLTDPVDVEDESSKSSRKRFVRPAIS